MSAAPSEVTLLKKIVDNIKVEPIRLGAWTEKDLRSLGMMNAKIGPAGILGILFEGSEAVNGLAENIFSDPIYLRGISFSALRKQMIDIVIREYNGKSSNVIDCDDVQNLRAKISAWFDEQKGNYEFYIPCFISPTYASTFSVGPIEFIHIEDFKKFCKSQPKGEFEIGYAPFLEEMARRAAAWIAKISVQDCSHERAQEIANLAVDVAIGGLQLFLVEEESQKMARLTGRTMPVFSHTLSRKDGSLSVALANSEPGRLFGVGYLDQRLREAMPILNSVGKRVSAYVHGTPALESLEQAWSDAAYWFHEGIAEPLDTIAVPKLETAIEVLLCSESTSGSKRRMLTAIEAFYGKVESDFINPHSEVTVGQLAQGFVRDRSRILHGTWSTLNHSLRTSRSGLIDVVRDFLVYYSQFLDKYFESLAPADDIDKFLAFVKSNQIGSVPLSP